MIRLTFVSGSSSLFLCPQQSLKDISVHFHETAEVCNVLHSAGKGIYESFPVIRKKIKKTIKTLGHSFSAHTFSDMKVVHPLLSVWNFSINLIIKMGRIGLFVFCHFLK